MDSADAFNVAYTPFLQAAFKAVKVVCEALQVAPNEELFKRYGIGAGGDRSLGADLLCEKIFLEHLLPFGSVHSEESGLIQGAGEDIIYLDPLDGSSNFTASIPYYGASISLHTKDLTPKEALVTNYCSQEIIFKSMDFEGGKPFVIYNQELKPFVGKGAKPKLGIFEAAFANMDLAQEVHQAGLKFRSPGAMALSFAYARYCRFVIYGGRLRPHDIEAGLFISSDLNVYRGDKFLLVSAEESVFQDILRMLKERE
ncbi:hypothetical protein CCZ01_02020 [Helicobacter monodelphidis]|uniref:inositol monophosphatase family protein n=1 Tax=Helicobacter sp. 15-1451 TaxID=2004995 RepID=UPI000DCF344B|nr:inositol monophosphatase family protein [Helicobacter sp. 15-1451]RAX58584.1 hypothetical protein CCZ01_02020 [Helicobacter sp. 15-1451]